MARKCFHLFVAQELPTKEHQQAHNETQRPWRSQQQQQTFWNKMHRHQHDVQQEQKEQQRGYQEQREQVDSLGCSSKRRQRTGVDTPANARQSSNLQKQLHSLQRRQDGCLMVLKIGTSTLMTGDGDEMHMSLSNVGKFVDLVCELRARGHAVVVVSSGAVGAGCVTLHLKQRPEQLNMKQAVASVGQCRLMRLYEDLFGLREQKVAQLLVSRHDLLHRKSYQNFRSSLRALLSLDVVPVINENDSLATEELRFGDNDTLAAHIAVAVEARWLFILTDVHCLYDKNPHKHSDARPVALVDRLTDVYAFLSESECGGWGTGGMYTKVVASKIATNMGVHVAIAHGGHPHRVLDMFSYVETCGHRLHRTTASLQQQTRRPSVTSPNSDDKAGATDPEAQSKICVSDALKGKGPTPARAVDTSPLQSNKRATTSVAIVDAVEPGGSSAADSAGKLYRSAATGIAGIADNGGSFIAGSDASGETPHEKPYVSGCGSGDAAHSRSIQGKSSSTKSTNDERAARNFSASRDRGDACGNSDGNTPDDPQQSSGTTSDVRSKGSTSDMAVDGKCGDKIGSFRAARSSASKVEACTAPCEQLQNKQQQQQQHCMQAEGDPPGTLHGAGVQRQQCRSPEGHPQEMQLHNSVLICENLQQMPFLGTVFLANTLIPHKRGDKRRWILSLPVRGKLFVDRGAVEALVQQKKSLFAAGVRHVVGNFTASECVAVYFDTCYGAISPDSPSGSADSRSTLASKKSSTDVGRRQSKSIHKCSVSGIANGQSRPANHCRNDEGTEPEEADTNGVATGSGQKDTQHEAFQEGFGRSGTRTSTGHTTDHGRVFASKRESRASKRHGSRCQTMREKITEKCSDSCEEAVTCHCFLRRRACCCSVTGCCCPVQPGEAPQLTDRLAVAAASPAVTAATSTSGAWCGTMCTAAGASSTASSDVKVDCGASFAWLDPGILAGRSTSSESYGTAATVGAGATSQSGVAWGLEGPPETLEIARCISNFSSAELQMIKGKKSGEFTELLGYPVDDEVAHRAHIVFTFMNGHEHLKQLCLGLARDSDCS